MFLNTSLSYKLISKNFQQFQSILIDFKSISMYFKSISNLFQCISNFSQEILLNFQFLRQISSFSGVTQATFTNRIF